MALSMQFHEAMDWSFLFFLGEPWFVVPWYLGGFVSALFILYDVETSNIALPSAMKWAWPLCAFFFSFVGLSLYFQSARAPGVGPIMAATENRWSCDLLRRNAWCEVTGTAVRGLAGNGLGIIGAMVVARAAGMSFWQEFWFEFVAGLATCRLLFHGTSRRAGGGRRFGWRKGELLVSMAIMGGMGAVTTYVTPMVATAQPKPATFAFWGFAMAGLLVGFLLSYPMGWMLLGSGRRQSPGGTTMPTVATMRSTSLGAATLAIAAFCLPAWLTRAREVAPIHGRDTSWLTPVVDGDPVTALFDGVRYSLFRSLVGLRMHNSELASLAIDDAFRAAEAGRYAAPDAFAEPLEHIRRGRVAFQQGSRVEAAIELDRAYDALRPSLLGGTQPPSLRPYRSASVINPEGVIIGDVARISGGMVELALGGWRNVFGFLDLSAAHRVRMPTSALAFGPANRLGPTFVAVPTEQQPGAVRIGKMVLADPQPRPRLASMLHGPAPAAEK